MVLAPTLGKPVSRSLCCNKESDQVALASTFLTGSELPRLHDLLPVFLAVRRLTTSACGNEQSEEPLAVETCHQVADRIGGSKTSFSGRSTKTLARCCGQQGSGAFDHIHPL